MISLGLIQLMSRFQRKSDTLPPLRGFASFHNLFQGPVWPEQFLVAKKGLLIFKIRRLGFRRSRSGFPPLDRRSRCFVIGDRIPPVPLWIPLLRFTKIRKKLPFDRLHRLVDVINLLTLLGYIAHLDRMLIANITTPPKPQQLNRLVIWVAQANSSPPDLRLPPLLNLHPHQRMVHLDVRNVASPPASILLMKRKSPRLRNRFITQETMKTKTIPPMPLAYIMDKFPSASAPLAQPSAKPFSVLATAGLVEESSDHASLLAWYEAIQSVCDVSQQRYETRIRDGKSWSTVLPSVSRFERVSNSPSQGRELKVNSPVFDLLCSKLLDRRSMPISLREGAILERSLRGSLESLSFLLWDITALFR